MKLYNKTLTVAVAVMLIAACFAFPTSAAAGDVLFSDDFSGTLNENYKACADDTRVVASEIVDGKLHFAASGNKQERTTTYILYEVPETVTEYTIYAEFMVDKFGDGETTAQRARPVGIGFNLPDSTDITWQASIFTGQPSDNSKLSGYYNGRSTSAYNYVDSTLFYPIDDDIWYALEIKVNDNDYIISSQVKKLTDNEWTPCWEAIGKNATGVLGFGRYVGILNRGNDMYIDNFKVTDNTPEKTETSASDVTSAEPTTELTSEPTSAVTPSESVTNAPGTEGNPGTAETKTVPTAPVTNKTKSCGGFSAGGFAVIVGLSGAAVVLFKKKYL